MPQGGSRGQNLGHLRFFFCFYFSCVESFNLNNMPVFSSPEPKAHW